MVEEKDSDEVAKELRKILKECFLHETEENGLPELLVSLHNIQLKEFSSSQQDHLSEVVKNGIESALASSGDLKEELNSLFEQVKPIYVQKYLSQLKEAMETQSKLTFDFDFNNLVNQHL